jgi:hypothetical protein
VCLVLAGGRYLPVPMKIVQAGLLRPVRIMAMLDDPRFVGTG